MNNPFFRNYGEYHIFCILMAVIALITYFGTGSSFSLLFGVFLVEDTMFRLIEYFLIKNKSEEKI